MVAKRRPSLPGYTRLAILALVGGVAGNFGSVRELKEGNAAVNLRGGIYAAGLPGSFQKIWPRPLSESAGGQIARLLL